MKKLSILFIIFALALTASADRSVIRRAEASPATMIIAGGGTGAAPATANCSEAFTGGSQPESDVAGNTIFETESESDMDLIINNNSLIADVGTYGASGFVIDTSGCIDNQTELTLKFKMTFDDILDVADTSKSATVAAIRDSDSTICQAYIYTDANSDIATYRTNMTGSLYSGFITMTGVAADTQYNCYLYYKEDATVGSCEFKCHTWNVANTGNNDDNTADNGAASIRFGNVVNSFGGGITDTYIIFDDFEVWNGDAR